MQVSAKNFSAPCPIVPHNIFYKEWGEADNSNVLIAVHGFSRNSGDFDFLAEKMADKYRIACPDMPGRGQSDWLPVVDYNYPAYLSVAAGLVAQMGVSKVDWVGTSMGGFLGMVYAAQPDTPIRKLVLNDVGPVVSRDVIRYVAAQAGNDERFQKFDDAVDHFKKIYSAWGDVPQAQWVNVARNSTRKLSDGSYALAYDPAMVAPIKGDLEGMEDVDIWPLFEAIQVPMLLLHGVESNVLSVEIAQEMKRRNKNVELVDFAGIGHCPSLMVDEQVAIVREWLLK